MKTLITILFVIILYLVIYLSQNNENNKIEKFYENNTNTNNLAPSVDLSNIINNTQNNIVGNNLLNEINNSNKQNPRDLVNICKGVKSSIEANFFVLKLNLEELKNKVQPTIWRNSEFCIYRMDPIMSTNNQLNNTTVSENDYYYSLGDVILFKNYNKFFNKPKTPNMFCNVPIQEVNNNVVIEKNLGPGISENFQNNINGNVKTTNAGNIVMMNNLSNISNNKLREIFKDEDLDNYRQPGIKGLRLFVKNGKKPVSFTLRAIIKGLDAIHLYIWEPIAPQGYVALGHYCTLGKNPPDVDKCNMRCVPQSCANELSISPIDIIQSNGIEDPYGIYLVSNGKYFKGVTLLPGQDYPMLKSYDLKSECMNVEVAMTEEKDFLIILKYENVNVDSKRFVLTNNIGETLKHKFEEFLLNSPDFKLNNSRNVPLYDDEELLHKRYEISFVVNNNNVIISLKLSSHSDKYEETSNENILNALIRKHLKKHKIKIGMDKQYYDFLLIEVGSTQAEDIIAQGYDEYRDPRLEKNSETAEDLVRGRFKKDNELDDFVTIDFNKNN
tara:strand:- start:7362 stop:9029 length:1668 start_codon:yes stop_codon:yes gene_type:complete